MSRSPVVRGVPPWRNQLFGVREQGFVAVLFRLEQLPLDLPFVLTSPHPSSQGWYRDLEGVATAHFRVDG